MKTRNVTLMLAVALCAAMPALCAVSDAPRQRAWMGVLLDTTPLPDLLIKHLGLLPGQGIRIGNVHRGSPADKAGLERDDIIIGFQGRDVDDYDTFVDDVRKAGVGTEVSLAIIHLGQRQTVRLKVEPFTDDVDLKYPPEPQIVQSWRPGKIFRLRPGDKDWKEILKDDLHLPDGMPPELDATIRRFFKELYMFHHSDGESYTITIEGDPDGEDATITVRAGDAQYKTTAKHIDKLPEKYREPAEQALKDARKASAESKQEQGSWRRWPSNWRSYLDRFRRQGPPAEPDDQMFDKIQEQMRELQKRLDKLEKHQREMLDSKA